MMLGNESSQPPVLRTPSLSTHETTLFDQFKKQCADNGLLNAPLGVGADDARDGVSDDGTLLYVLFGGFLLLITVVKE